MDLPIISPTPSDKTSTTKTKVSNPKKKDAIKIAFPKADEPSKELYEALGFKKNTADGKIGDSSQGDSGDCWALSGINALAKTKKGAKLLQQMVKEDPKKHEVTVTLPNKEKYSFPKTDIALRGDLSTGDLDVRVLEMAMEKNLVNHPEKIADKPHKEEPVLEGGSGAIAFGILSNDEGRYTPNYAYIDDINPEEKEQNKKDLINELDSKRKHPNRYAMTTAFKTKDGDDIVTNHEYAVTKVDAKNVTLSNPWDSGKKITMPRTKFLNITAGFYRLDLGK